MKKLVLNLDYINTFTKEEYEFEVKTEIAYVIGIDNLDKDFKKFIEEETYCDGIYAFSILVRYLYEKYLYSEAGDIYEFLTYNFEEYFESFKKDCFKESE